MKHIYIGISKLLTNAGIDLRWIDLDTGQLEYYTLRPGIDFPAVLIDIAYPQCDGLGGGKQQRCTVDITLRIAFEVWDESNMAAPEQVRIKSLKIYDIIEEIHNVLQGNAIETGEVLYRTAVKSEKREDGLKVFNVVYKTKTTE